VTTSIISNVVSDLSGFPVPGTPVVIDLIPGPGWRGSDSSELFQVAETVSDINGSWAVPLERSSNLDPRTSYYRVREMLGRVKGGTRTWFFDVPDFDCKLHDCLRTAAATNSLNIPLTVTSNTRPVNPYVGMQIFETDTGRVLYYYGTTLGWRPDWGIAWGEVVGTAFVGDFTTSSTVFVDVTGCALGPFTMLQGRQYITIVSLWLELTGTLNGPASFAITDNANVILNSRDILPPNVPFTIPAEMYIREAPVLLTAPVVRKLRTKVNNASEIWKVETDALHPVTLSVRDAGPQAPPVIT
jgi:hypothetical protein